MDSASGVFSPNIIAPRHSGLTFTPVRPRSRYSTRASILGPQREAPTMKLLVLRHDVAEPRDPTAGPDADAQRSLTDDGRKRARRAASALVRLVEKLDVLGSSGLRRADETADVLAAALGGVEVRRIDALRPGAEPQALVSWLRGPGG